MEISCPKAGRPKSDKNAWALALTLSISVLISACGDGQSDDYGGDSSAVAAGTSVRTDTAVSIAAAKSTAATVYGVNGRPTLNAFSALEVVRAGQASTFDFTISGPQRGTGGYQSWTDKPWASVQYLGELGKYRLTIDTSQWAANQTEQSFTLTANNDAGQTLLTVVARIGQLQPTPAPVGTLSVTGSNGRPSISTDSSLIVQAGQTGNPIDFTISGAQRAAGGYQSRTNRLWASVSYLGSLGQYRVNVDTSGWGQNETSRTFQLIANNDAGQTVMDVEVRVPAAAPAPAVTPAPVVAPAPVVTPVPTVAPAPVAEPVPVSTTVTVNGESGRPTLTAAETLVLEAGASKVARDFVISGPQRSAGGYQTWTNTAWAFASYNGSLGSYRITVDTSGWGANETSRSFNLIANNDAGQTILNVTAYRTISGVAPVPAPAPVTAPAPTPAPTTSPTTAPTTAPVTSDPDVVTVTGVDDRPTIAAAASFSVSPNSTGNTLAYTISGPQIAGGGYQSWSDQPWASVRYAGQLGQYEVSVDTSGWAAAESSRSFQLIANNNAGQTLMTVQANLAATGDNGTTEPVTGPEVVAVPAPQPVIAIPVPPPALPTPEPVAVEPVAVEPVAVEPVADEPVAIAGSCSAKTAPGAIKTTMVTPSAPVSVPKEFMGMHRSIHLPNWRPNGGAAIAAPTFPYGVVRNLRMEVDGQDERGFWRNIEVAPGVYDWSSVDQWAQANAGHPIIWMIYGTPSFYQKYPGEPSRWPSWTGIASPPTNEGHDALKRFAQAVKARYGTQIAAFEVWNEPTLPWTGGATSYDDRWSPEWGRANGQYYPPFFSGSASDLANIAYTLNSANLGVPVIGAAFVDLWSDGSTTVERFLNAPVTLPGGWGTGKSHIQGLSTHFYDYNFTPDGLINHVDGYRKKLREAGIPDMPIWGTETGAEDGGVFSQFDWRAPIHVQRWVLIGASKGLQSLALYGHFGESDAIKYLGGTIDNPSVIASLTKAYQIGGQTICNAAVLTDGRVWVNTAQGQDFLM